MSGLPSWKSAEKSPFFCLFRPFSGRRGEHLETPENRGKKAFFLRCPRICLNPHLLNPPFAALQIKQRSPVSGPQRGGQRKGAMSKDVEKGQNKSRLPRRGKEVKNRIRRTQEGCGGLGGENPAAFPKAGPIFQQPFSLPENAQTLAGIASRAAGKSGKNFPAASKFAGKPFQQGISDSHSLLELSEKHLSTLLDNFRTSFPAPSGGCSDPGIIRLTRVFWNFFAQDTFDHDKSEMPPVLLGTP